MSDYKRNPRGARRARKSLSRKALVVLSLMMVLVMGAVGGTIAWLTAESGTVTNTFAVGDINIELKEHGYVASSNSLNTEEVTANSYKIVPGAEFPKDPFVRVQSGSEPCYVYVAVQNNLKLNDGTPVATINYNTANWTLVASNDTLGAVLYRYNATVNALNGDQVTESIFVNNDTTKGVNISGTVVTKENITQLDNDTIVVMAYAHQFENTTQTEADTNATAWFNADPFTTTP